MAMLSKRIERIKPSATLAISALARSLREDGEDVISLSAGEPDFDTPVHVCLAAMEAIKAGETRYTNVDGIFELKDEIRKYFSESLEINYSRDQVIVSNGGKQIISGALAATLNDGDEVIIPAPFWVSYPDMVQLAGGKPMVLSCTASEGFKLSADKLENAITSRTRWLILNSPGNPSGAVYSAGEIKAICDVLSAHPQIFVLSDDIYEHLVYDSLQSTSILKVMPEFRERTLVCNGVSKAYAMTGWRIGYGAGPAPLIRAMAKIQSQTTSNPCSISQWAALAALSGPQDQLAVNREIFQKRRDLVVRRLNECTGIQCNRPSGAFYAYPGVGGLLGMMTPDGSRIQTDEDFTTALLQNEKVAVVPGSAFGLSPFFRVSYSESFSKLEDACERIERFCKSLT